MDPSKSKAKKKNRLNSLSRWLHTYLSMLSFILVLFFAMTGLTLNHAEWFDGKEKIEKISGFIPLNWVNNPDTSKIQKLTLVEWFRKQHHIRGSVSDFIIEEDQVNISFKGPGYSADAFINRKTGTYKLKEIELGMIAIFNDLHKGRDTGKSWSIMIDLSAIFMVLVSITGLLMMVYLKKKRFAGFILIIIGSLIFYIAYKILVP